MKQLTLGELILEIKKLNKKDEKGNYKSVCFDFGSAIPTVIASWRGSYALPALGYKLTGYDASDATNKEDSHHISTNQLLKELRKGLGNPYQGWKGGTFYFKENSRLFVDNQGNFNETGITKVEDQGWKIMIHTKYFKY